MVISGGFELYPSDLEAVVGVPSPRWGETPVAFAVPRPGSASAEAELRDWANARLGKVLKCQLREGFGRAVA